MNLILDIETVPMAADLAPFEHRAIARNEHVTKFAALSTCLSQIVCVGLRSGDWEEALVGDDILERLYEPLEHCKKLVTFGGKGFDVPMLAASFQRSGMSVPPFLQALKDCKPWESLHVDMCEELSWGGKARRPSLHEACVGFGIPSPKCEGDGAGVQGLWMEGKINEIAAYCLRDCRATQALARRVLPAGWEG